MERPEIISKLSFYLIDKEPLIYLFIINSDFIKDEIGIIGKDGKDGYAGVCYKNNRVQFYYTDNFLNLPLEELYFILIHEAQHIFKHHLTMHSELENVLLRNIAEDAIINEEISTTKFLGISPKMPGGKAKGVMIPSDFKSSYYSLKEDAYTTPRLYNWYLNKKNSSKKEFLIRNSYCKNKEGQYGKISFSYEDQEKLSYDIFENKESMLNDFESGYSPRIGHKEDYPEDLIPVVINGSNDSYLQGMEQNFDFETEGYFDANLDSEEFNKEEENIIPQRVFTESLVKQATEMTESNKSLKAAKTAAGIGDGNSLLGAVKKILKSDVNWRKEFKQGLNIFLSDRGRVKGIKDSYITHLMNPRSRYGMIAKHNLKTSTKKQNYVIIAMDTSGSCFYDNYDKERFFTEIDSISKEMEFNSSGKVYSLMWDWSVNGDLKEYKHGDWKNYQLSGGGGTNPHSVFSYFSRVTRIKGNSAVMKLNDKEDIYIENIKKMPFLLFLTDGYFFDPIKEDDLWLWKRDKKSLMFMTRNDKSIPSEIKRVIYK